MTTFNSLSDAMKHIEKAIADSMREVGEETEDIMKDEVQKQVYDDNPNSQYRTGQLKESIEITKITDNGVEVSWRDNGDWFSLVEKTYGDHMYVIHGLDMGKTWFRDQTNLVEESNRRVEEEIPDVLRVALKSKGINVK